MFVPKLALFALLTLAWGLSSCAHRAAYPERATAEPSPTSVAGTPTPGQGPRRAEDDPRYALPPARKRALGIYLGSQTFEYLEDDRVIVSGPISSGSAAHPTPSGDFRVLSKDPNKRSGSYTNYFNRPTPMPYSLQFHGPYFIHEGWLPGYADSHGCVRLRYEDARLIFHRIRVGDPVRVRQRGVARAADPWPSVFPVF